MKIDWRIVGVIFLLGVLQVNALGVTVSPPSGSTTSITNQPCGSNAPFPITITNGGSGGALCWYTTNDVSTPQKLTSTCVRQGQTQTQNAMVLMPNSGTKTITVNIECFDFWTLLGGDQCQDSFDYNYALMHKYSSGQGSRTVAASCTALSFQVSPPSQTATLYAGQSSQLSFTVSNNGDLGITCSYTTPSASSSIGAVGAHSSQAFSVSVTAPQTGQATTSVSGQVTCQDSMSQSGTQPFTITISYSQDPAKTAIETAQNSINSVKTQLQTTEHSIQAEKTRGVDTAGSFGLLEQAKSLVQQAETQLASAASAFQSGGSSGAKASAEQANSLAQQASTLNGQALAKLEEEKQAFESGKQEAANLVDQAKSKIAEAQSWIERAEAIVANATSLGMDTVSAKTSVASAKSSLTNANSYYQKASADLNSNNYDLTKQDANNALTAANQAESNAQTAYNSLNDAVQKVSIAANLMSDATSEISKADQTYTKFTLVVRESRKYAEMSGIDQEITDQKAKIDEAKDALSQAQNRFKAGYYDQAVEYATKARDTAASAKNRLDRVVEQFTYTIQDALTASLNNAKTKTSAAQDAISSAASTYAVSGGSVASAQEKLNSVQIDLKEAETQVSTAKNAAGLSAFLDQTAKAFETINAIETKTEEAKNEADSAKTQALATIGVGGAAVVGAGGVGFMWWRKRKKKGEKGEKQEKKTEAPAKSEEKPEYKTVDYCKKCNREVNTEGGFCQYCGRKLTKKKVRL